MATFYIIDHSNYFENNYSGTFYGDVNTIMSSTNTSYRALDILNSNIMDGQKLITGSQDDNNPGSGKNIDGDSISRDQINGNQINIEVNNIGCSTNNITDVLGAKEQIDLLNKLLAEKETEIGTLKEENTILQEEISRLKKL